MLKGNRHCNAQFRMFRESHIGQWTIHEWALSFQTISTISKEPVGGPPKVNASQILNYTIENTITAFWIPGEGVQVIRSQFPIVTFERGGLSVQSASLILLQSMSTGKINWPPVWEWDLEWNGAPMACFDSCLTLSLSLLYNFSWKKKQTPPPFFSGAFEGLRKFLIQLNFEISSAAPGWREFGRSFDVAPLNSGRD